MAGGQVLSLPEGVRPIWLEGLVNSEYERDTLPLLFSSDEVFNEYYEVLAAKNESFRQPLEMIKARNKRARDQRSGGFWQECLDTLAQCLHLRRCVFSDDDFQYSAAVKHHILTTLNFATFFLKESRTVSSRANRDGILAKAFQLFKQAEEGARQVDLLHHCAFFRAAVATSLSNYFFRRNKMKAACQQAVNALKHWGKSKITHASSFFIARDAVTLCFCERWEEAAKALSAARKVESDPESSTAQPGPNSFEHAPVRFSLQLLSNPMPITDATNIVLTHNLCVTMIALRRYKEAAFWCQKAMNAANSNSQHLAVTHPWVKAIKECQSFCSKTSFSLHYQKFRMKPEECNQPEFQQMQRIIHETRTMPIFNSMLQQHRQKLRDDTDRQQQQEVQVQRYKQELEEKAAVNRQQKGTSVTFNGSRDARKGTPGRLKMKHQPLSSLRHYMNQTTYTQFVEEYMAEKAKGETNNSTSRIDSNTAVTSERLAIAAASPQSNTSSSESTKRRQLKSALETDAQMQGLPIDTT